jgi:hypothetical protein
MMKNIRKVLWFLIAGAAWSVVLLTLFPHFMTVFDSGGAAPYLLVGSLCIVLYHVMTWFAREKVKFEIADIRESANLLRRQTELKRRDCINEYIHWLNKEYKAKEYIKNKYPGEFSDLDPLTGDFKVDVEWIDKDLPDNYEFRKRLEELKKGEKLLWERETRLRCKEEERKAQHKELHPGEFCSVEGCLLEPHIGALCIFHGMTEKQV